MGLQTIKKTIQPISHGDLQVCWQWTINFLKKGMKIVSELEFCPKCEKPYTWINCRISGGGKPDACLECDSLAAE